MHVLQLGRGRVQRAQLWVSSGSMVAGPVGAGALGAQLWPMLLLSACFLGASCAWCVGPISGLTCCGVRPGAGDCPFRAGVWAPQHWGGSSELLCPT